MVNSVGRNTQGDRLLILLDSPTKHCEIFLTGSWSKINKVGYAAKHWYIEKADMRNIIHRCRATPCYIDNCWVRVNAEILCNLVVGALDKRTKDCPYWM